MSVTSPAIIGHTDTQDVWVSALNLNHVTNKSFLICSSQFKNSLEKESLLRRQ